MWGMSSSGGLTPGSQIPGVVPDVRWGPAIGYGLGAALAGGLIWGLIAAVTGYIFGFGAIAIGLFIAWAVWKGGGHASPGLIAVAFGLTLFSVYLGEITALSILLAPYGIGPVTVIARYFSVVAEFPGDTLPSYFFGLLGAGFAAYSSWTRLKAERAQRERVLSPPFQPAGFTPLASAGGFASTAPSVQVLESTVTRAAVRVDIGPPTPHIVEASYSTWNGMAIITMDGRPFAKTRVWGMSKQVDVPLDGASGRALTVHFRGAARARIEVLLDGRSIGGAGL
jgi:hypothetical protein